MLSKKNRCAADSGSSSYSVFRTAKQILPMQRQLRHFLPRITASVLQMGTVTVPQSPKPLPVHSYHLAAQGKPQSRPARQAVIVNLRQHRIIPALRLKHRSGGCGTASAVPKCSIMSGCGTRIVLRGQKPLALCDRCPCFGSLFPPLAALTFAASSIICAFGLASAAPRSPYRHLELCGIALIHPPLFPFSPLLFFFLYPFCFPAFHLSAHLLFQQTCNKKRAHQVGGRGKSIYRIF